jgi:hypothetical protein
MANEITVQAKLSVVKSFLNHTEYPGVLTFDMSGSNATGGAQNIGTAAETITMGDVSTAGYSYFRNLGPTNFVDIGSGTGTSYVPFLKLKAGEVALCRLGTNAPTARANVAAVNLQYYILQD